MNKAAGRPRAADLEARNQNLIETAGELFLSMGYSKVSLELIARQAHVAVRTIYVKFGGKAGLFQAVLIANRDRFIAPQKMESDERPLKQVIGEFSEHFLDMVTTPQALALQRMVIAEANTNPELAQSFYEAGPRQSREALSRFFEKPHVRAQLREDLAIELLPSYLINCVLGDPFSRFLFDPASQPRDTVLGHLHQRLDLFYKSVLRHP
ncbi:TetR/AcrR family transcriptional regulator [Massilia sp. PAMC28688]|uniref:TetR/AcrR family transcriptional regulator n=1 Tax=Massilia sp. PAMC28688 TaxID=2861283 RepID=UPI001C63A0DF|nr:TetR/AcrR family transcriptional regulator [Massilia sp. PAMC28688]QYF91891.1 TetR/AcrR family transcriptional regulator [Massilia sp. PAMC28688]